MHGNQHVLGHSSVEFLNTDFLLDANIPAHDVVFLSEVHNHFLFPFYGLLRVVNLAREAVIWDGGVEHQRRRRKPWGRKIATEGQHGITLNTGWNEKGGLIYHSF